MTIAMSLSRITQSRWNLVIRFLNHVVSNACLLRKKKSAMLATTLVQYLELGLRIKGFQEDAGTFLQIIGKSALEA